MTEERKKELKNKYQNNEIKISELNEDEILFLYDECYDYRSFNEEEMGYIISWVGEQISSEEVDRRRWHEDLLVVKKIGDRFFEFEYGSGLTEDIENDYSFSEMREIFPQNVDVTALVKLPKMEFVFDSAKITPAKIDKDMIDFEKAEQKVEEIEKLYNVVFTDVKDIKKYREEVASTKSSAEKFKKDLMDYLTADTKEINQKLINLIKRVDAVRKYLYDKEKELDNAKREKVKSIKQLIFKDRPEYLVYLVENKKWENKTFKEINIEAEIQQQYDELIKKENFIKQEIEKANKEIRFKILFENVKYLIKEEYTVISEAITNKMNEIKQTEENLRKTAKENAEKEKQQEIEALKQQQEQEKQEAVAKAIKEKEVQENLNDNSEKTDTYICIKVNGLTKEATNDLLEVIKKHNLKYIKEMK
ncbi:Uncharacterised protein [uncultured Leptotrichia sp.]|uniref:hypothetical protein n=1 Tax=uncultured Leptotrichia sp. TaxID=159271 RepID=UPI001A3B641F|nr:hypothetical protein [uncultured Leptotrichia sp.]VTX51351.1 Uncharacterised protein [uncultured Leptotrichia sp.]